MLGIPTQRFARLTKTEYPNKHRPVQRLVHIAGHLIHTLQD